MKARRVKLYFNRRSWGAIVLAGLLLVRAAGAEGKVFHVRDFGAKGDGEALDTAAIQKAIDACQEAGGGEVRFTEGKYLAGTILLRSNLRLHLDKGATLLGSRNLQDYVRRPDGEFCHGTASAWVFLHGCGVENVTIDGEGTIDGAQAGFSDPVTGQWRRGPLGILFERSKNISLADVTVTRTPGWAVTFFDCDGVAIRRIRVLDVMADGINPVCCRHVLYDGVTIDGTGDDPITIKNEGPVSGLPLTTDIVISNCVVRNTRHPGFKIGTGTAGVFRHILVKDCVFDISGTAFTIQLMRRTVDPERVIEDLQVSNVQVKQAKQLFDITTMGVERPVIRNLTFSKITYSGQGRGLQVSRIWGTERAPIRGLTISNLTVLDEVKGTWLSLEHVEGARIAGVRAELPHAKTALKAAVCRDVECEDWDLKSMALSGPVVSLKDVHGCRLRQMHTPSVTNQVFVTGEASRDIALSGLEPGTVQTPVIADDSVPAAGLCSVADGVSFRDFGVSRTVKPNESPEVRVTAFGAARAGPFRVRVSEGPREVGAHWAWLRPGQEEKLAFHAAPLYESGRHRLSLGGLTAEVVVAKAPAAFQYGELAEIESPAAPGGLTRVKATVKNVGGKAGRHTVELKADGRPVSARTVSLKPGEECDVTLEHRFQTASARVLNLGDFPPWPFFTTANVDARFFWGHQRLIINAGGEPGGWDQYATIYARHVKGDFDAVTRLHRQSMTTGNNSAIGLIIRNDLTENKARGFTTHFRVPMYGAYKIWYLDLNNDGILDTRSDGGDSSFPCWYKFEKRGRQFRAYTSSDRVQWTPCGKWFTISSAAEEQDVGIYGNAGSALGEKSRVEFSDFQVIPVPTGGSGPDIQAR